MAPIPTALAIAGGAAVDKAADHFTDSSSWAQWLNRRLGLRDNSMIGQFTNPGMIVGGTIGAKASPAVSRAFKYAWETIPKEPLMTNKSDLRATIRPEELANRKFFSVEEYGSEPIYTRETAPTRIKVKEGDIIESHMNDGTPGSEVKDANKVANEWFTKANHGQSASYETDYSLSTDSYPIALLKMNRWQ